MRCPCLRRRAGGRSARRERWRTRSDRLSLQITEEYVIKFENKDKKAEHEKNEMNQITKNIANKMVFQVPREMRPMGR